MNSEDTLIVRCVAIVAVAIVVFTTIIAYFITLDGKTSHAEETKQITACVNAGGEWTDVTPDKYADMGCLKP